MIWQLPLKTFLLMNYEATKTLTLLLIYKFISRIIDLSNINKLDILLFILRNYIDKREYYFIIIILFKNNMI